MPTEHLIYLSIPGLRSRDVIEYTTPMLHEWANDGALAEMTPTFPCVTSPAQATQWTGAGPEHHGVIANGFYHRDRGEVEFWVGRNNVVEGEQIWDALRSRRPGFTSAVWHAQNIKDCGADYIVTPAPIHEPDGTTRLWCYSKPDGLYQQMLGDLGQFPLQHYWGPLSNIESTRWILSAASWLIQRHEPNFHWIYIPHLDYASQKFGPDSMQAQAALFELDVELTRFAGDVAQSEIGEDAVYLIAGEYAMTDVAGVIYPNRLLREAGLLKVREQDGHEHIDLRGSEAFAMVDHQFAHVYLSESQAPGRPRASDTRLLKRVVDVLQNVPGLAAVYAGDERAKVGMNHPRSGEIILICEQTHWLAYYWWFDDAKAPPFARTVDIHSKPGFDAVELFIDPATTSLDKGGKGGFGIPLDATLIKGSHGIPATAPQHRTAIICSKPTPRIQPGRVYADTDIKEMTLALLTE